MRLRDHRLKGMLGKDVVEVKGKEGCRKAWV